MPVPSCLTQNNHKGLGRARRPQTSTKILYILGSLIILQACSNVFISFRHTKQKEERGSNNIIGRNFIRAKKRAFIRTKRADAVANKKTRAGPPKPKQINRPSLETLPYPYARSVEETITSPKRHVREFERQDDVVIVTKIHGRQMLIV